MRTAVLLLFCCLPAFGQKMHVKVQSEGERLLKTDTVLPPMCGISATSLAIVQGSKEYVHLRYVVESLSSGVKAAYLLQSTTEEIKAANNLTQVLTSISDGQKQAIEATRCGADLMPTYPVSDKDDALIRDSWIIAFNQFSEGLESLRQNQLERISSDQTNKPPASALKDAEKLTKIYASSRDATSSMLQLTALNLLKATDSNDPKTLSMTCAERSEIQEIVKPFVKSPDSVFKQSGALIQDVLNSHSCHESSISQSKP